MDQFSTYTKNLFQAISTVAGFRVTYVAKNPDGSVAGTCSVMANHGRSRVETDSHSAGRITAISDDWIIQAASIAISGTQWTPQEGDQIIGPSAGTTATFELMTPPFNPHDALKTYLRLHSKQIGVN